MTAVTPNTTDIARARHLLTSAAKAVGAFEGAIRELVALRAWELLGYENLSVMWETENGFKCPTYAKVLAVEALESEGVNTRTGFAYRAYGPDGHITAEVALAVGLPTHTRPNGTVVSSTLKSVRAQLAAGVPADRVVFRTENRRSIEKYGTRARRTGENLDERVQEGFHIVRRDADAITEIARRADVPKSEIYRQAVAEFLARHAESHGGTDDDI